MIFEHRPGLPSHILLCKLVSYGFSYCWIYIPLFEYIPLDSHTIRSFLTSVVSLVLFCPLEHASREIPHPLQFYVSDYNRVAFLH